MRKVLLSAGMLVGITATAQETGYEKRVGINTETPRASFEVKATNNGKAQGILFPHISEEEKAKWAKDNNKGLVAGTVIWNTTKICLDYFDGTNWQCTDGTKPNVHPTPWTPTAPPATSYTGRAVWGDDTGETISATRNNCPSGQRGSTISYPTNAGQHITYTATSTVSQADADQKALDLMNSTTEVAKRQQLAQDYANTNGTCTATSFSATKTESYSQSFTKNNCTGIDITGTTVTYTQTATATATSTVSQADADRLASERARAEAQRKVQAGGQAYANANGNCQYANSLVTCQNNSLGRRMTINMDGGKSLTLTCKALNIKQTDGRISRESYYWTNHPGTEVIANNHTEDEIIAFAAANSYPSALYLLGTDLSMNGIFQFINRDGNTDFNQGNLMITPYYTTTSPRYGHVDRENYLEGFPRSITLHWLNKTVNRR